MLRKKIESVLTLVFLALGSAITIYTAQNFGAKKVNRISQGIRAHIVIGMTFCVIFGMFICLFWDGLVGLFVVEQEIGVKNAALQYVQIAISVWLAHCLLITFRNIVRTLDKMVCFSSCGWVGNICEFFWIYGFDFFVWICWDMFVGCFS